MPSSRREKLVFGLGVLLGVIGASLLVAFGVHYVKPYRMIRHMEWGTCAVTSQTVANTLVTCACDGSGCLSKYPCVHVRVNFTSQEGLITIYNVTLYDSYDTYLLQKDTRQCSYHKCHRAKRRNLDAVMSYTAHYGTEGQSYWCHYDPKDPSYVIHDVISRGSVVNAMLWPALALVVGVAILVTFIFNLGPRAHKSKRGNNFDSFRPIVTYERRYQKVNNILSSEVV